MDARIITELLTADIFRKHGLGNSYYQQIVIPQFTKPFLHWNISRANGRNFKIHTRRESMAKRRTCESSLS